MTTTPTPSKEANTCAGLVLAGGRSTRFGSDKTQLYYQTEPLLFHQLNILLGCDALAVSCNTNSPAIATQLAHSQLAVDQIQDDYYPMLGPLSGIYNGLLWARKKGYQWLCTVSIDCLPLPGDYYTRMLRYRQKNGCIAHFNQQAYFTHGIWPISLIKPLQNYLPKQASIWRFAEQQNMATCYFAHTVHNINTPQDWKNVHTLKESA